MSVIQFAPKPSSDLINLSDIQWNRQLSPGLIGSAREDTNYEIVIEHDAEPIKQMEDIIRIQKFLVENGRYRDNMLFIVGINFGLRVSDLLSLRFSHLIVENNGKFDFRSTFPILEKKTKATRKIKKNRYITINNAVIEAVTLYLKNTPNVYLSDYMFRSQSNRGGNLNKPLDRKSVERILKGINNDLSLGIRMATHTLRKTFGYHQMVMSGNDPRKLLLLQKIYGHSTSAMTLNYIGITGEEIEEAYRNLNLGGSTGAYLVDSAMCEEKMVSA